MLVVLVVAPQILPEDIGKSKFYPGIKKLNRVIVSHIEGLAVI